MNKKSIITILLAFVAMAGQAQVKSGLDLCLRNETTGEWLIGLFDDYAIYDCEYWDYAEVRKGRIVSPGYAPYPSELEKLKEAVEKALSIE